MISLENTHKAFTQGLVRGKRMRESNRGVDYDQSVSYISYICIYIYIHIYMYIHIHIHIYIYIYTEISQ
jgi:hypothetical protein